MNAMRKVVLHAAELVEGGWCQNTLALDARGKEVDPCHPAATSFCLVGALFRANSDSPVEWRGLFPLVYRCAARKGYVDPVTWNNTTGRTKEEVAAFLREAASGEALA
jgi:hypothetical protein